MRTLSVLVCLFVIAPAVKALPVELHNVQFPEKRQVNLSFRATQIAPAARIVAEVTYRRGQARIEMTYDAIKPAILFGGDVTCFVVWAVTRDGQTENLGELMTRKTSGKLTFSTGKKAFALLVTAESFYLVSQPSELVSYRNAPSSLSNADSEPFTFDGLAPAPRHNMDGIAHIKWDSRVPLDLLQARKAFELAGRYEAPHHAPGVYADAQSALNSANQIAATSPKGRELQDVARRAVMLSTEALNISMHRIEAKEIERKLAQRRAETEALERRAAEAEASAEAAEKLAAEVRTKAELARIERERLLTETTALRAEKSRLETSTQQLSYEKSQLQGESARLLNDKNVLQLESQRLATAKAAVEREAARLRGEKAAVDADARRLQREKDELNQRLQSALSHVADTQESARGFVINLPDILFDLNEADLKPETKVILAKLTGILLIIGDQDAIIEGHTDSTGTAEYNRDLSQRRASAVLQFLHSQGLESRRLKARGYGMDQPVADNSTPDGRKRNRRVEIVITEHDGTIAAN